MNLTREQFFALTERVAEITTKRNAPASKRRGTLSRTALPQVLLKKEIKRTREKRKWPGSAIPGIGANGASCVNRSLPLGWIGRGNTTRKSF